MSESDKGIKGLSEAETSAQPEEFYEPPQPKNGGIKALVENPYMLSVALFASIGGILFGYDQGAVGNVLPQESFQASFPEIATNSTREGWVVSILLISAWLGSLLNSPIADNLGRKRSIQLTVIIFCLGSALQAGAKVGNDSYLFAGRAVAGLAVGAMTQVVPLYLSEIAPAHVRGSLVALQQLSITFGILISYWLAYGTSYIGGNRCSPGTPYTGPVKNGVATFDPYNDVPEGGCDGQTDASWRVPLAFQVVPAIILGIGMFWFPYSPRFLVSKGRTEEALQVFSQLRRLPPNHPDVQYEWRQVRAEVALTRELEAEMGSTKSEIFIRQYTQLFETWPKFKRLAVGCLVMFYQQFVGCNAIIYYAPTIFGQLGLSGNTTSLLATGVYGVINFLSTIPAVIFVDIYGRKPLLLIGAAGTFASLIIVGSIIAKYEGAFQSNLQAGYAGIAFVFIYDVFFSFSFAPIGWILPSEVFPIAIRSTGISITTSCTWMCNFIIGLVSPIMLDKISFGTFYFFAGFAFIAFFNVYFFFPETKGATLEDMDIIFGDTTASKEKEKSQRIARQLGLTHLATEQI